MQHTLLVSSVEKGRILLLDMLRNTHRQMVCCAQNGAQARRRLLEYDFSLVAINTPLNDEFGIDLAVTAAEKSYAGVLLLVRSEQADEVSEEVEQSGVVVVPKPVSREYFHQAARLAVASHRRLMNVQKENDKLQDQIEEIRLVNRAKYILMEKQGMSEAQAHRYVEKTAMDRRTTRGEIAREILDQNE